MRSAFIDNLKGLACLLIVFHHLAFYGPMSDVAQSVIPELIDFFFNYGRWAVAVFLCLGGYLTGLKISEPNYFAKKNVFSVIGQKYIRLALPYLAAIALAMVSSFVAKQWMSHDSISNTPEVEQLISHVFFLQNILGYESLSAGLWYVAIDFQLFVVCALIVFLVEKFSPAGWTLSRTRWLSLIIFGLLIISSTCFFNLDDAWDVWFVYFFAAYGLGLLTAYFVKHPSNYVWIFSVVAVVIFSLYYQEFRERLLLALLTAMLLAISHSFNWSEAKLWNNPLASLGRISYSVFLVHFPVSLIISSAWTNFYPTDPWMNVAGMSVSVITSILVAIPFYRYIETR